MVYEIPLSPEAQVMDITLGTIEYRLRFYWSSTVPGEGGWFIDIGDTVGSPLLEGLAVTAGENILQQFDYFGFEGGLWVATDMDELVEPTYANLGDSGKVYFVTP